MYSIAIAAEALGVPPRQLDNFVRRYLTKSVRAAGRGTSRSVPHEAIELAAVALILVRDLGCRPHAGVRLASALVASHSGRLEIGTLIKVEFDFLRLRGVLAQAIADAVEYTPLARRGRPPGTKRKRRGTSEEAPRRGW